MLRLHPNTVDYVILAIYFAVVLGIGFGARLFIKTDLDFFLSGRSLPAWITGLAFIAANLGVGASLLAHRRFECANLRLDRSDAIEVSRDRSGDAPEHKVRCLWHGLGEVEAPA